jgi:hypothetical protein
MMRRLEVLNNTLSQNTKYIVPSGSDLVAILGLDAGAGVTPLPLKTGAKGSAPPSTPSTPGGPGRPRGEH